MAITTINTRIQNKIDLHANWLTNDPVLLNGEIAIAVVEVKQEGTVNTVPAVLMKVGDGTKKYSELDFSYAKAADVYDWAKAASKPSYNAGEITGIDTYIAEYVEEEMGISVDTDTQYQLVKVDDYNYKLQSKGKTDEAWADVAGSTVVIPNDTAAIEALQGLVGDVAVATQIANAIAALNLDTTYEKVGVAATEAGKVQDNLDAEIERATAAEEAASNAAAAALDEAQAKVASVAAGDASVTMGGTATAPTVAVKLSQDASNAIELAEDGLKVVIPAAAEYSIVKAENSGDYAAIYNLTKGGEIVGASINIPKDMVVESGSVVENPEGQTAGTYIKLVLQNVAEPLYINVGSLIEYVTSGSQTGDMVFVTVSDDHKVTATITDGTITLAKLHTDVQTAIGKAHTHENAAVLAGITADKVSAWDASEQNAKDYADGLNTAMNTRVEALEAIDHSHANQAELDKIVDGDKAKWDDAAAKAHEHANKAELDLIASGDKAKWDAKQDALTFEGTYNAESNKVATQSTVSDAVSALDNELAAVAKSGNYADLVQTEGDLIIFDCGSATKNIAAPTT